MGHSIISKTLEHGLAEFHKHNLRVEMFYGKEREAITFILTHVREHDVVPAKQTIQEKFGEEFLVPAPEPFAYYAKLIKERFITNTLSEELSVASEDLGQGKLDDCIDKIKAALTKAETTRIIERDFIDLIATADARYEAVMEMRRNGEVPGYLMPWATLNACCNGVRPGELWVFAGALKMGKTFIMTYLMSHFYRMNLKVLFVSMEMRIERIAARFDAIHFRVPYEGILKGRLTQDDVDSYTSQIKSLKCDDKSPHLAGTGCVSRPCDVELMMSEVKPDIVIIDAIYRMKPNEGSSKQSRWESMAAVIDELQKLAIRRNIPIVCSTQFNRKQKKDATAGDTANIGLAYEIPQNADMVLGILRPPDLRGQNRCLISMMEGRDAADYKDIMIHWNLVTVNFDEIGYMKDGHLVNNAPQPGTKITSHAPSSPTVSGLVPPRSPDAAKSSDQGNLNLYVVSGGATPSDAQKDVSGSDETPKPDGDPGADAPSSGSQENAPSTPEPDTTDVEDDGEIENDDAPAPPPPPTEDHEPRPPLKNKKRPLNPNQNDNDNDNSPDDPEIVR